MAEDEKKAADGKGAEKKAANQETPEQKRQKFLIDYDAARRKIASGNLDNIAKGAEEAKKINAYDLMQRAGNEYEIAASNAKGSPEEVAAKRKEYLGRAAELYKALAGQGEYSPGRRVAHKLLELGDLINAMALAEQAEAVSLLGRVGEAAEKAGQHELAAQAYIASGYDAALGRVMESWSPANGWGSYVLEQQARVKKIFEDRKPKKGDKNAQSN